MKAASFSCATFCGSTSLPVSSTSIRHKLSVGQPPKLVEAVFRQKQPVVGHRFLPGLVVDRHRVGQRAVTVENDGVDRRLSRRSFGSGDRTPQGLDQIVRTAAAVGQSASQRVTKRSADFSHAGAFLTRLSVHASRDSWHCRAPGLASALDEPTSPSLRWAVIKSPWKASKSS